MAQYINKVAYGLTEPLPNLAPAPIRAKRAPTTADKGYSIGQIWIYVANDAAYILTSIVNNLANWQLLESSGGAGVFSTLTSTGATTLATAGPLSLGNSTGLTTITPATASIASPSSTATLNANVGVITCSGFTTADAGGVQSFTITNNKVTASSFVSVSAANLNASTNGALISVKGVVVSANTLVVTVANNGAGALGAGDNVLLSFTVNS